MPKTVLGAKLKKLRKGKGLTQRKLSEILGFSKNYIAKVESGEQPSLETFRKLAAFFETPLEYLVSEREDNAVMPPVRNQAVLEALLEVDRMEEQDQRLVLNMVGVITKKNQLQAQVKRMKG
jgi:transcriptional regulator with XRE-family HTH domain